MKTKIEKLNIGESLNIESEYKVTGGNYTDVRDNLAETFGEELINDWNMSVYRKKLKLQDKVFELLHGNTRFFSIKRIE